MLAEPGGIRASQALKQAEERLEEIKDDCLLAIDAKIDQLGKLARIGGENEIEQCYYVANEIFAEAGVFQLGEVSEAAHSLCALLSAEPGLVPSAAVVVHADTLRALRSPAVSGSSALKAAVLAELKSLTAKLTTAR